MKTEDLKITGGAFVPTHEKAMKMNTKAMNSPRCGLQSSSQ